MLFQEDSVIVSIISTIFGQIGLILTQFGLSIEP